MTQLVNVVFRNSRDVRQTPYTFLADDSMKLNTNDAVVVDAAGSYQVAYVDSVRPHEANSQAVKWVVQKVDVEGHKQKVRDQLQIVLLQKELDKKVKAFQEKELVDLVVKHDPSAAKLLQEINSLKGGPVTKMQENMWRE